ncbi:hypothetical protein SDC9_111589 [bioreactor metagenome]|uniref:Uncharacterized protein n=1 Tax=bioreactor metagenome TaxID=1076179 RepID=A0A645BJH4_9ZZZZ
MFNGKRATRLVISPHHFQMESRAFEPAGDSARWQKNSSGESRIVRDENVDALKIDASFNQRDKWVYPRFTLNKEERSAFDKAVGLSFEIRTEQNRKEMSSPSLVWITMTDGKKYRLDYKPSLGDWGEVRIMFPEGQVQSFEIGMNPKKESITYWIRNVRLLYER